MASPDLKNISAKQNKACSHVSSTKVDSLRYVTDELFL